VSDDDEPPEHPVNNRVAANVIEAIAAPANDTVRGDFMTLLNSTMIKSVGTSPSL
jgi:hypothetical protein